jgi:proline iminopeptidase
MRWGATDAEVAGPYPGAELVPGGERSATMAVTIDAPPDQVWPWLVQMGWGRGGWYSWDRLDNGSRPSAREVHPEWQDLAVGDYLKFWAPGRGVMDAYKVAVLEPNRFLGLLGYSDLLGRTLDPEQSRPSAYLEGLWGFRLNELSDRRTRLVISGYQAFRPRWYGRFASSWLYIPVVWPMQARMLAVLKRNIERAAPARTAERQESGPAAVPGQPGWQASQRRGSDGRKVVTFHGPCSSVHRDRHRDSEIDRFACMGDLWPWRSGPGRAG